MDDKWDFHGLVLFCFNHTELSQEQLEHRSHSNIWVNNDMGSVFNDSKLTCQIVDQSQLASQLQLDVFLPPILLFMLTHGCKE